MMSTVAESSDFRLWDKHSNVDFGTTYVGTKIVRYPCFGQSPLYMVLADKEIASKPTQEWRLLLQTEIRLPTKKSCIFSWWKGHFSDGRVNTERKDKLVTRMSPRLDATIFELLALFLDFERRLMTKSKSSELFSSWISCSFMTWGNWKWVREIDFNWSSKSGSCTDDLRVVCPK
jgi:hypothetical protein